MPTATIKDIDELPALLTKRDLGALLGLSPVTVTKLTQQAGFPLLRVGYKYRIPRDQFLAWLDEQTGVRSRALSSRTTP